MLANEINLVACDSQILGLLYKQWLRKREEHKYYMWHKQRYENIGAGGSYGTDGHSAFTSLRVINDYVEIIEGAWPWK